MNEIEDFELEFAKYIGVKHVIAVSSGTAALMTACHAIGLKEGQKVITTPFSFFASSSCIIHQKAEPVYVDIHDWKKTNNFNINPERIEFELILNKYNLKDFVGILPVHLFGQPCNMDYIMNIAKKYNLWVIEDCAQSCGAKYKDKRVGSIGDIGCFSFYATKNFNCYEGGAITTNNNELAKKCREYINHGSTQRYLHDVIGFNFRMSRDHAQQVATQLRLHSKGAESELGSYGIQNGHYPYVIYDQKAIKDLGITGNCPNAERAALEARKYFKP